MTILTGNPAEVHPGLEMILSEVEEVMFSVLPVRGSLFNLTKEKLFAMRGLTEEGLFCKRGCDQISF